MSMLDRYPLEWLWKDGGVIYTSERVKKPNGADGHAWVKQWEGKCKLSFLNNYASNRPVANDGMASSVPLLVRLFLPCDVDVLPGSRVDVSHQGRIYHLKDCGVPAVFSRHQELLMEVVEEWA